jgi:hypothetical protein
MSPVQGLWASLPLGGHSSETRQVTKLFASLVTSLTQPLGNSHFPVVFVPYSHSPVLRLLEGNYGWGKVARCVSGTLIIDVSFYDASQALQDCMKFQQLNISALNSQNKKKRYVVFLVWL